MPAHTASYRDWVPKEIGTQTTKTWGTGGSCQQPVRLRVPSSRIVDTMEVCTNSDKRNIVNGVKLFHVVNAGHVKHAIRDAVASGDDIGIQEMTMQGQVLGPQMTGDDARACTKPGRGPQADRTTNCALVATSRRTGPDRPPKTQHTGRLTKTTWTSTKRPTLTPRPYPHAPSPKGMAFPTDCPTGHRQYTTRQAGHDDWGLPYPGPGVWCH